MNDITPQEIWTGQPPPHGAAFTFAVKDTPAGKLVVFTCSSCGGKLGAFLWGNPASKLPAEWWRCKCGCNDADKRCAVAIALREWGKLSDRAIAEMCAVNDHTVATMRRSLNPGADITHLPARLGRDGKEYPARREPKAALPNTGTEPEMTTTLGWGSPSCGNRYRVPG